MTVINAQEKNIKIYNGVFNTDKNGWRNAPMGVASYEYFDNEKDERVYDGFFILYENSSKKNYLTGYFKNNIVDSIWCYYKDSILVSTMKFTNGKRQGKWSYKEVRKVLNYDKTKLNTEIWLTVYFKDNNLDSSLDFSYKEVEIRPDKTKIIKSDISELGSFKDGYMDGNWFYTDAQKSPFSEKYIKGVFYYSKEKDLSTGEVKLINDSVKVFNYIEMVGDNISNNNRYFRTYSQYSYDHQSIIASNLTEGGGYYYYGNIGHIGDIFSAWGFNGAGHSWGANKKFFNLTFTQIENIVSPACPRRWLKE